VGCASPAWFARVLPGLRGAMFHAVARSPFDRVEGDDQVMTAGMIPTRPFTLR